MSPVTRSPILSSLARTKLHRASTQQFRSYATARGISVSRTSGGQVAWGRQWKDVAGVATMYFPVVAVVMFWPYAVPPVMKLLES